jgi:phage terminase large subunit-like protein
VSKTARAHAVSYLLEAGIAWLPAPSEAPWVTDLEAGLLTFPAAAHDDQVDAMTRALRKLCSRRGSGTIASGTPRVGGWGLPSPEVSGWGCPY